MYNEPSVTPEAGVTYRIETNLNGGAWSLEATGVTGTTYDIDVTAVTGTLGVRIYAVRDGFLSRVPDELYISLT